MTFSKCISRGFSNLCPPNTTKKQFQSKIPREKSGQLSQVPVAPSRVITPITTKLSGKLSGKKELKAYENYIVRSQREKKEKEEVLVQKHSSLLFVLCQIALSGERKEKCIFLIP